MALKSLDHVTINTALPKETVAFYTDLLGMKVGWRPPLDQPGAWLYVGDHPVVHLFFVDSATKAETGDFDHFAFLGSDFPGLKARLIEQGIDFKENTLAGGSAKQLFFPDPNNVKVEINFPQNLAA
jgi:catechol 2,3-dioxygenase-like lactoylglutathione lyase family enzyme